MSRYATDSPSMTSLHSCDETLLKVSYFVEDLKAQRPRGIVYRPRGIVCRPRGIVCRSRGIVCRFRTVIGLDVCDKIVSDLSIPAFLAAFRRFISRRGKPFDIFTDNITNFKGAKNILNNIHQLVKDSSIQRIKSLKYHLLRCLKSAVLNFEELNTLTSQIEACLNSRPLYPMSLDPNDFNPLTPGHFLIGRPLTALPEPSYHPNDNYLTRWKLIQKARDVFWQRWSREYLNNLQQRSKWKKTLFQPEGWSFGVGKRHSYAFNAVEPWPHHQGVTWSGWHCPSCGTSNRETTSSNKTHLEDCTSAILILLLQKKTFYTM
ncbi:hypothetical protein LAZ67_1000863 [Cordylochernes scorpioides]|uniref:DUF5641 domain-containing protein n=1 Tax=Cordylochernes scorpioides TaxID=51811 RepID=A0ABY6JV01_9ARAC|nr:hypothetical protein LAZ67_1000863 [Cordylochernes scorpioides]